MEQRKALLYLNSTGKDVADDIAFAAMERYCKLKNIKIVVGFCECTDKSGFSQPGFYTCVGMAATKQIDTVVTVMKEMIGSDTDDIINSLSCLRDFGTIVVTLADDLDEFYKLLDEIENEPDEGGLDNLFAQLKEFFGE